MDSNYSPEFANLRRPTNWLARRENVYVQWIVDAKRIRQRGNNNWCFLANHWHERKADLVREIYFQRNTNWWNVLYPVLSFSIAMRIRAFLLGLQRFNDKWWTRSSSLSGNENSITENPRRLHKMDSRGSTSCSQTVSSGGSYFRGSDQTRMIIVTVNKNWTLEGVRLLTGASDFILHRSWCDMDDRQKRRNANCK